MELPNNLPHTHRVDLGADLRVDLPLVCVGGVCFYSFNLLGQARVNRKAAEALALQMQQQGLRCDALVAVEAKSIGLIQELATILGHERYAILRKSVKTYMVDPLVTTVQSITTQGEQQLVLDHGDADWLKGKTVCFVDDVISTGATIKAARELFQRATGEDFAYCACVATEGAAMAENPHRYVRLGHLPLYTVEGKAI